MVLLTAAVTKVQTRLSINADDPARLTSSIKRQFNENQEEIEGLDMHETILKLLKFMAYDPGLMKNHLEIFETKLSPETI